MNLFTTFMGQLLPHHCYLCGDTSTGLLCSGCQRDLPLTTGEGCACCALPVFGMDAGEPHASENELLCGDCLRHPKPFQRTLAAFVYDHPIDFLINRFKHHRHFLCGEQLSEHLLPVLYNAHRESSWPDLLLPMPLHWTRRCIRGFNQSDAIAYHLHKHLGIPVSHCCRRLKRNPRQQSLKRKARLRNLRGAFSAKENLEGRHVAVIDDVMTTGATVTELTHCLRDAGAERVDVWVLARVP